MSTHRHLLDVTLQPSIGSRFQPTGFPDLDAGVFDRPVGDEGTVQCLLVESAQSMANRLESVGWDDLTDQPVAALSGLPYVRVVRAGDGGYLTSSRTEAHRLASAFIKDATLDGRKMIDVLRERLGLRDDTPVPPRQVASAVFALDPLALVHGVFFADKQWPGQPKVARALTGFIEAVDVHPAESGGVKKDHVRHSLADADGGTAEGYGTVPFHRQEWTARTITASFSIDRRQIAAYGLGPDASELLEVIAMWEVRTLLESGLRLRTACDLEPTDSRFEFRSGEMLPSSEELAGRIAELVAACGGLLGPGGPIDVVWDRLGKKAKS